MAKRQKRDDEVLQLAWAEKEGAIENARKEFVEAQPFPHWRMENFLKDEEMVDKLEEVVMKERFNVKENDLFSFVQSGDLADSSNEILGQFVRALYSQKVRDIMTRITGVEGLTETFDLTSSVYSFTNNLLCHDDELNTRRVAYILYLVPSSWTEEDGGCLDLFTVDANKQPNGILKSIVPKRNTLLFFEVSDRSYHQVAEVLTQDKMRISIGGWFHGPRAETPKNWKPVTPLKDPVTMWNGAPSEPVQPNDPSAALKEWINPVYLAKDTHDQISECFEKDSFILLHDFLIKEKYEAVHAALNKFSQWKPVGPFQKLRFDVGDGVEEDAVLKQLVQLFRSEAMADLIHKLTTLSIEETSLFLRKMTRGCYSLVHDLTEPEKDSFVEALDLHLTLINDADAWADEENSPGGQMVYTVEGEEEPLIVVQPVGNMLAIVFRADPDTQSFIKYVNSRAPSSRFDLSISCKVKDSEEGEASEEEEEEGGEE